MSCRRRREMERAEQSDSEAWQNHNLGEVEDALPAQRDDGADDPFNERSSPHPNAPKSSSRRRGRIDADEIAETP
jgi:hypothetical protein